MIFKNWNIDKWFKKLEVKEINVFVVIKIDW